MRVLISLLLLLSPSINRQDESLEKAIRLYEGGKYEKAAGMLKELSRSAPDDSQVKLWLGKTYIKTRKWDDAVKEMEKASRTEPANPLYRLWLGRACGARAAHSFFLTAFGWARRVIREFKAAADLAPEDLDIRFDMLEYYLEAPGIVGGGEDKAKAEIRTIERLDPRKGFIARAMLYKKKKQFDLAKRELLQATIEYPDEQSGYKDLADFLLSQEDFEGALRYSQKALELGPSKRARLVSAASRIRLQTDLDEVEQSLQELASGPLGDGDPSFEEVYYWLGECYLAKGNEAKARDAITAALSFDPDFKPAKQTISKLR